MDLPDDLGDAWAAATRPADPLAALAGMADLRDALSRWEASLARDALAAGASWTTVGNALGTSRQAAWERLRPAIAAAIEADRRELEEQKARLGKRREKAHDRR